MSTCCGKVERAGEVLSLRGVDRPSCRRSPRRPSRRASSAPRPNARREGTSPRRSPATSVVDPPPKPTIHPSRPISSSLHSRSTTASVFASSPAGTRCVVSAPRRRSAVRAAARLVSSAMSARPSPGELAIEKPMSKRLAQEDALGVFARPLRDLVVESAAARRRAARTALGRARVGGPSRRRATRRCRRRPSTHATNAVRRRRSRGRARRERRRPRARSPPSGPQAPPRRPAPRSGGTRARRARRARRSGRSASRSPRRCRRTAAPSGVGELPADRRLPRAHEPDQREVLVYRADHGMRSR